jgi:hypothetical protein
MADLNEYKELKEQGTRLCIRDTDFLLRLIAMSSIDGRDLEQALETKMKINAIHKELSEVSF